jgi:hypothetical protein
VRRRIDYSFNIGVCRVLSCNAKQLSTLIRCEPAALHETEGRKHVRHLQSCCDESSLVFGFLNLLWLWHYPDPAQQPTEHSIGDSVIVVLRRENVQQLWDHAFARVGRRT